MLDGLKKRHKNVNDPIGPAGSSHATDKDKEGGITPMQDGYSIKGDRNM